MVFSPAQVSDYNLPSQIDLGVATPSRPALLLRQEILLHLRFLLGTQFNQERHSHTLILDSMDATQP